ncbi:MAG: phosphomannomutase/phosphoglucomutase [Actinobacteria bacterium]|nr:phosphomannomutase/phosphoglucomutase [Actinomycetota bacterium]
MPAPRDLSTIIKAYDVRGVVPDQLDADIARAIGAAFARFAGAPKIVIARDMRESGVELSRAFAEGAAGQGVDVVDAGMGSTDLLYFAAGSLDLPGAMFTASHNPAKYNGIKLCLTGARPVGQESGLAQIRSDAGMGGLTVPVTFKGLPLEVTDLYFELDGSFPNHEANPIEPENLRDLQAAVLEHSADLGLAFDGDADRCFVVDERGEIVSPSVLTALIAVRELAREPGSTIIHNLITSRAVPEIVREHGGTPVRTRVGHSFIKAEMARTGAVFGGEHSGHFYFREFWNADSGMLAALHTLAALGETDGTLSALLSTYSPYVPSGEINSTVEDQAAKVAEIKTRYADLEQDELDGLTVSSPEGWWFNVRASNTEPLLRLNVEGPDEATMSRVRDDVLGLIRGQ